MKSILFLCLVCVAIAQDDSSAAGVQASSSTQLFNFDTVVVNPGQRVSLECGVKGTSRHCIWEKSGTNKRTFQVEDVHEGFLKGLSKPENTKDNQCGIILDHVSPEDNGKWTCKVFVRANTLEASKNVVVTVRPTQPLMSVNEKPLVIKENEVRSIDCMVPEARPAARIRWFLGTEDVTGSSTSQTVPTDDVGTYRTESTLVYTFTHIYDRRNLRCSVEHQTLDEPEYTEVSLDIRYQPYPISSTEIYGIPMDTEYEIKYNFTSNPVPEMRWYIEGEEIPVPGESGRYMASIKSLMDNIYMATLKIKEFTKDDISRTYRLQATNDFGEQNFDISLSTGPAPLDGVFSTSEYISTPESNDNSEYVATGTIVAIIVIVIVIIVLLFIIGVMRYRQMYCFGSKDKITNHLKESEDLKDEHDTESSAAPPKDPQTNSSKKSATNLLKNIKSKFPIPSRRAQPKEPRLDKLEEGEAKEPQQEGEDKGKTNPEVVYAELELGNGNNTNKESTKPESTEYAEIICTQPDNKMQEKKE